MLRQYEGEHDASHLTWQDFEFAANEVLEAAAPILAEEVAQRILAHAERQFPKNDPAKIPGRPDLWRTWHRHFGIAARIAAGAFYTREDELRLTAEAIQRGDFIACDIPEVPDAP
jgi:hypothetical protein